jgi:hypothetical protein
MNILSVNNFKDPKIVYVKSFKDIPKIISKKIDNFNYCTRAVYNPNNNTIYAVEKKINQYVIEHEKYHAMTNDDKEFIQISHRDYIRNEIEATKYAYDKTSHPRMIYSILTANSSTMMDSELIVYACGDKIKIDKAMELIWSELIRVNPPNGWINSYKKLANEIFEYWNIKIIEDTEACNWYFNDKKLVIENGVLKFF